MLRPRHVSLRCFVNKKNICMYANWPRLLLGVQYWTIKNVRILNVGYVIVQVSLGGNVILLESGTEDVQSLNVPISDIFITVRLLNRSIFGMRQKPNVFFGSVH